MLDMTLQDYKNLEANAYIVHFSGPSIVHALDFLNHVGSTTNA